MKSVNVVFKSKSGKTFPYHMVANTKIYRESRKKNLSPGPNLDILCVQQADTAPFGTIMPSFIYRQST